MVLVEVVDLGVSELLGRRGTGARKRGIAETVSRGFADASAEEAE